MVPSGEFAVQSLSHVRLFATPWIVACQASLSSSISWSLLKLMFIESMVPSNHLIPFSSCLQSFPASGSFLMSWLFESGGQTIGSSASASVHQMNIQELISFRIDWFGLFAVEILKSFLQHHVQSINSAALTFFMAQLSHRYMTTGTTIALTRRTFVSKVMFLLFIFFNINLFILIGG